jgi:hypothetical protein
MVVVIESKLTMQLPPVEGSTIEEIHAAMNTDSAKDATAKSLSESLGVDSTQIIIIKITVTAASRRLAELARRLNTGNMHMAVDYEVHLKTNDTAGDATTQMQAKMTNIGSSNSSESKSFAGAFTTNLAQAASAGSSALSGLSSAVQTTGLQILHATAPVVSVRTVPASTYSTPAAAITHYEPSSGDGIPVVGMIAIVAGSICIVILLAVIGGGCYYKRCKPKEQVEDLPLFDGSLENPNSDPNNQPRLPPAPPPAMPDPTTDVVEMDALQQFDTAVLHQSISSVVREGTRPRVSGSQAAVPILQAVGERESSIDAAINAVRQRALSKAAPQPPGSRATLCDIPRPPGARSSETPVTPIAA